MHDVGITIDLLDITANENNKIYLKNIDSY